jgi:hypothetical protein
MFVEPWSSRYFCRLAGGVPANPSLRTLWWQAFRLGSQGQPEAYRVEHGRTTTRKSLNRYLFAVCSFVHGTEPTVCTAEAPAVYHWPHAQTLACAARVAHEAAATLETADGCG